MKRGTAQLPTPPAGTKIIKETTPPLQEVALKTLKNLGVDIKLETGDVEERKSKIFSWLVKNELIEVGEENGKPVVKASDKLRKILGTKNSKAVAAMIKWAAEEEGTTLEHVEPVAKVLAALEEFRQISKKKDPALAKALEKAMKSKHTIREIYYMLQGIYTPEELSRKWSEKFGTISLVQMFERYPELAKATLKAMEEMKKKGITAPPVPKYWANLPQKIKDGAAAVKGFEKALSFATAGRLAFSAFESIAIRGLPESGREIETLLSEILERIPLLAPWVKEIPEQLQKEVKQLARLLALMKDPEYIGVLEAELQPMVEKIPESKKVGLFRRESPRRKVEDFATLLMEGNLSEEEAERKAEELKGYLKAYLSEDEIEALLDGLMLPFRAKKFLKAYGGR
ncbi:hypothetical protein [Thermococcus paralvinellae]|uniref:Uncharacterized protein n=1 Tax=Thermococcus paralvinellae TaxID=582419 RepID=W0I834_9EURY|nr:hypothetical protein [Thermococcus paralvinellae]AHF80573.1 Hypothetical protein TES1_1191 [Thermococcus paralvinellae]